jgi:hypothetical protein
MTNDEIRDALKIMKQRVMGKGLLRMTDDRTSAMLDLIIDAEMMLTVGGSRPRNEIVADIERELQVK